MKATNLPHKHTDLTYLIGIANGSNKFIVEMMTIFIDQIPQAISRMEAALKSKDWKTLRMVVHKIKPSILFTGLNEIADDVPLLEEYASQETHLDATPALVSKIKAVCTEAITELKEEREKILRAES